MGSGGSGAGAGGGGYSGGGLANTGGTGYGGDLGGYGTAGEMSGGAGGSAMAGFGNTGAGGSGMAGVSSMSGMTPPGFTPSYGDPRGTSIGMDAYGNYKGTPGYVGMGAPGKPTTMNARDFMAAKVAMKPKSFSTAIPTTTNPLSPAIVNTVAPYVSGVASFSPYGTNPFTQNHLIGGVGRSPTLSGTGTIGPQVGIHAGPTSGMAGSPAGVGLPGGNYSGPAGTNGLGNTGGYSGNFSGMGGRFK